MTDDTKQDAWTDTHATEISDRDQAAGEAQDILLPDASDLFTPHEELAFDLPLEPRVNEVSAKRGAGRPKGATNKKDTDLLQYLMAKGYRSPLEANAAIYNMNTLELARQIRTWRKELKRDEMRELGYDEAQIKQVHDALPLDPMEVLRFQASVAAAAYPYWHAKHSPDEAPPPNTVPMMVIGEMNMTQINDSGAMSAGIPPDAIVEQNQSVGNTDSVRQSDEPLHNKAKTVE